MYLLIFEDGTIQQSATLPDEYDESIEAGALDIVRFKDGLFEVRDDGGWSSAIEVKS